MLKNLTRNKLSDYINSEFGLSKLDCNQIVNEIIKIIITGLIDDNIVKIHNFGTFKLKQKNQRIGRNPKTQEVVIIDARKVISFIPSKHILYKINKDDIKK